MKNEPEVGKIVRLKSGGPLMTVSRVSTVGPSAYDDRSHKVVTCYWFDKQDVLQREDFFWDILKPDTRSILKE